MMWNNKKEGSRFEREFAEILASHGFWVHRFQDNKNGQPCDVVASRNGHTYLFDCKDCKCDRFKLSRMEENQLNAMHLFEMAGNSRGKFAIQFPEGEIVLVDYWELKALRDGGVKSIRYEECILHGTHFAGWLYHRDKIDGWSEKHAGYNRQ